METYMTDNQYSDMLDVILAFNREAHSDRLLDTLLTKMMDLSNADAGTLYLLQNNNLYFRIVKNRTVGINQTLGDESYLPPIELDAANLENVSAYAAIKKQIVIVNDVYTDTRFNFTGPKEYDKMTGYRTQSMLLLPMILHKTTETKLLGVVQLINAVNKQTGQIDSFSNVVDDSLLIAICNIATNVLSNFLHIQEVNQLLGSLIDVTTQAIAERSAYSKNHTQNVSKFCHAFAEFLHNRFSPGDKYYFTDFEVKSIAFAALLHDIGKIITPLEIMDKADRFGTKIHDIRHRFAIKSHQLEIDFLKGNLSQMDYLKEQAFLDDALDLIETVNPALHITEEQMWQLEQIRVLNSMTYSLPSGTVASILTQDDLDSLAIRTGTLTAKEREIMNDHVLVTARLLDKIVFPEHYEKASKWAANHHELLDGSGYPKGLKGDEIDTGSRILTIADIFDALVSKDRPYKKSIPIGRSLEILNQMADEGKLDKELVSLFAESRVWEQM